MYQALRYSKQREFATHLPTNHYEHGANGRGGRAGGWLHWAVRQRAGTPLRASCVAGTGLGRSAVQPTSPLPGWRRRRVRSLAFGSGANTDMLWDAQLVAKAASRRQHRMFCIAFVANKAIYWLRMILVFHLASCSYRARRRDSPDISLLDPCVLLLFCNITTIRSGIDPAPT
jgi:hypothetical protein